MDCRGSEKIMYITSQGSGFKVQGFCPENETEELMETESLKP